MRIDAIRLRALTPPQDSLLAALSKARLRLAEGDIIALASKAVSIDEGRCVPMAGASKDALMRHEADWWWRPPRSRYRRIFTIAKGALVGSAGIDESNGAGHYILYPTDPFKSARRLRRALMRAHGVKKLGLIITDSTSLPLRRGAIGFALAWAGLDPLRDYRGTKDLFGRTIEIEMANLADALAAAAVLAMGEGAEQTPAARIRGAPVSLKERSNKLAQLIVDPADDLFAPLLWRGQWRRGGANAQMLPTGNGYRPPRAAPRARPRGTSPHKRGSTRRPPARHRQA